MTILPKKKAHLPNAKSDRRNAAANEHQQHHHRYGGVSPAAHSTIDVTSGAMSTSGVLPQAPGMGSLAVPSAVVLSKRGHRMLNLATTLSTSKNGAIDALNSSGEYSSNAHGVNCAKQSPSSSKQTKAKFSAITKKTETCNSDDEYGEGFRDDELEIRFAERLKKTRGFIIKDVKGDGACMFRAVADQVYGDEEMHTDVRILCMDYIAKNRDHFSQFLTEDFDEYLERKRKVDAHGNHVELQAISEIYLRPIEIYEYSMEPINTFHPISPEANTGMENPPLRLSYHGTVHYNSVVDPFRATIGVGLGLPDYKPGLADRNLMKEAQIASEAQHIEEAMLNDKLRMTDWERTEEELSKEIAKESYMEYLRQQERGKSQPEKLLNSTRKNETSKFNKDSSGNYDKENTSVIIGKKRGNSASSPDISSSRQTESNSGRSCRKTSSESCGRRGSLSPQAKVYRDERSSSSLPNIDSKFGSSLFHSNEDLMKPSTSASSLSKISSFNKDSIQDFPDNAKDPSAEEDNVKRTGLYEELLAASAIASDDWASESSAFDETAEIARALALSQQEFYESMARHK